MKYLLLTALSLLAFAANSLLARLALAEGTIDPLSFTTLRLVSGVLILLPVSRLRAAPSANSKFMSFWKSGFTLFCYAAAFSLGYVKITASIGTLIMVGSVQVTMIGAALIKGERLSRLRWLGFGISMGGLVYLVFPGIQAPDPAGAFLMFISGAAFGFYSIQGRGAERPIIMTSMNFCWAAPLALIASILFRSSIHLQPSGIVLAMISGAVTSGLGYIIWYKALKRLTVVQASLVQLLIPVMASFGGIAFLEETLSFRLIIASLLILGGVAMGFIRKSVKR